jgi:CheY-like chemotaxis protein
VYLPRATRAGAAARVPGPRDVAHRARGHETILLVEDEESVRTVAAMILRRGGYHVLEARSGGDALVICEHHASTIHLLLTDVVMPHMNGPELAERLRRLRPKIRVLFMSGYTDGAIVGRAPNGDAGFLQKPFTPDALFEKVRAALDAPAASARYARSAAAAPAPRPPRPPRRRPPT